ncbi:MAG: hypothetical protein ACK4UN_12565 [Limisphaerales bacterium]
MKKTLIIGIACAVAVALGLNVAAQEKKRTAEAEHGHAHPETAPHGGTVVKLGKHAYNLEFVRDPDAGKFQVFVLDAHMEYVPAAEKSFTLLAKLEGKEEKLTLEPVAGHGGNKSSVFEGSAEWIKGAKKFEGTIPEITLNGKTFTNVSFAFPKASKAHKH